MTPRLIGRAGTLRGASGRLRRPSGRLRGASGRLRRTSRWLRGAGRRLRGAGPRVGRPARRLRRTSGWLDRAARGRRLGWVLAWERRRQHPLLLRRWRLLHRCVGGLFDLEPLGLHLERVVARPRALERRRLGCAAGPARGRANARGVRLEPRDVDLHRLAARRRAGATGRRGAHARGLPGGRRLLGRGPLGCHAGLTLILDRAHAAPRCVRLPPLRPARPRSPVAEPLSSPTRSGSSRSTRSIRPRTRTP